LTNEPFFSGGAVLGSSIVPPPLERIPHAKLNEVSRKFRPRDACLRAKSEIDQLLDWLGKVNFGLEGMIVRLSADGITIGGGGWPLAPSRSNHHSICFESNCPAALFAAVIESNRTSFEELLACYLMGGSGHLDQEAIAATRRIALVTAI